MFTINYFLTLRHQNICFEFCFIMNCEAGNEIIWIPQFGALSPIPLSILFINLKTVFVLPLLKWILQLIADVKIINFALWATFIPHKRTNINIQTKREIKWYHSYKTYLTHRLESANVSMGCPANFSMLYLQSKKPWWDNLKKRLMLSLMNEEMSILEMCELSSGLYCFSFLMPGLISSLLREVWWYGSEAARGFKRRVSILSESQYPDTSYRHVWKPSTLILLIRGYCVKTFSEIFKPGT